MPKPSREDKLRGALKREAAKVKTDPKALQKIQAKIKAGKK